MIGKTIRKERQKLGLSQEELSRIVSVTQQAVNKWENGKANPDLEAIKKLARLFNCSTDYLLGYTDNPSSSNENSTYKMKSDESTDFIIKEAISSYPEIVNFWSELAEREDLQLLFKQTRDLSPESIRRIIKIIKAIEDEEAQEDA